MCCLLIISYFVKYTISSSEKYKFKDPLEEITSETMIGYSEIEEAAKSLKNRNFLLKYKQLILSRKPDLLLGYDDFCQQAQQQRQKRSYDA